MKNKIINILAKEFNIPERKITDKVCFGKYSKWDSLFHISLVVKIEEIFDVILEPEEISQMRDVSSITQIISKKLEEK